MPTIRRATMDDAALITRHRHQMFAENGFASEERLVAMSASFEPWLREHLADRSYLGLLLEESNMVRAGAGVLFHDFPPHFLHLEPMRAYLLNFYTEPDARGHGYARLLVQAAIDECAARRINVLTLHASRFGKPVYERFGFADTNEMRLELVS